MSKITFLYRIIPKVDVSENMSPETGATMGKHFDYLKDLLEKKVLILAGPCLDREYGIAIFEAQDEEEAKEIMNNDPCISEGVMSGELHHFKVSLLRGTEQK